MLNITIALRRLFTKAPSQTSLEYAWWYELGGRRTWCAELEKLSRSDCARCMRVQDRRVAKLLETWDTTTYRTWLAGRGPGGKPAEFPGSASPQFTGCTIVYTLEPK